MEELKINDKVWLRQTGNPTRIIKIREILSRQDNSILETLYSLENLLGYFLQEDLLTEDPEYDSDYHDIDPDPWT